MQATVASHQVFCLTNVERRRRNMLKSRACRADIRRMRERVQGLHRARPLRQPFRTKRNLHSHTVRVVCSELAIVLGNG